MKGLRYETETDQADANRWIRRQGAASLSDLRRGGFLLTTSKQSVDGEPAGSRENESEARPKKQEFELIARESSLELDQQDGTEHVAHEAERDQTSQQTDHESNTAEELEYPDQRSHQAWERDAHLRERTGNAGEPKDEQLLRAVSDEDCCNGDTKHGADAPPDDRSNQ